VVGNGAKNESESSVVVSEMDPDNVSGCEKAPKGVGVDNSEDLVEEQWEMSKESVKLQNNVEEKNGNEDKSVSGMSALVLSSDSVGGCSEAPMGVGVENSGDLVKEQWGMSRESVKSQNDVGEDNGTEDKSVSGMAASAAGSDSVRRCPDALRGVGVNKEADSIEE
jgi:hypothetical protein